MCNGDCHSNEVEHLEMQKRMDFFKTLHNFSVFDLALDNKISPSLLLSREPEQGRVGDSRSREAPRQGVIGTRSRWG
jgi:hypothetical protein